MKDERPDWLRAAAAVPGHLADWSANCHGFEDGVDWCQDPATWSPEMAARAETEVRARDSRISAHPKIASDDFLLWIRSGRARTEIDATIDPEWNAKYGEHAWKAALAVLGLPEDYDVNPDYDD